MKRTLILIGVAAIASSSSALARWDAMRDALKVFCDEANYPIYFHCKAGADRTGTLAFFLEGICGCSQTDIDIDYELTSVCGDRRVRNTSRYGHRDDTQDAETSASAKLNVVSRQWKTNNG